MNFKGRDNQWKTFLLIMISSFLFGMIIEDQINFPTWGVLGIELGIYLILFVCNRLIIAFTPLKKIERKIRKRPYQYQQLNIFFDEYIPETKKKYPQKIYKYIALDDISDPEREIFNSHSSLE